MGPQMVNLALDTIVMSLVLKNRSHNSRVHNSNFYDSCVSFEIAGIIWHLISVLTYANSVADMVKSVNLLRAAALPDL